MIIDEFQRAGDRLLTAVKALVDEDRRPGQVLLTGSTSFLTLPTISESLAGRVHIIDLWTFTQGEAQRLGEEADAFLLRSFDRNPGWEHHRAASLPSRRDYLTLVCKGGYPEALKLDEIGRRRFFRNYLRTITGRDVPEISRIRQVEELPRILRLIAGVTVQQVDDVELARHLNIDRRTLRANYLPLLQTVYLTLELPPWSRNPVSRVSKHPTSYLVDTGIAAHLLGVNAERLTRPTAPATGALVETFAVNELIRQASRFGDELGITLYDYRAHAGAEIDVIAEANDGRVVAIEIKSASAVSARDFLHLASVRDRIDGLSDAEFVWASCSIRGTKSSASGTACKDFLSPRCGLTVPASKH